MNKEKDLANGIYLMLNKKENGFDKDKQAEIIGKLLLEAKSHSITKTILHLLDIYLKDIAKDTQMQIKSNRGIIYDSEKRC